MGVVIICVLIVFLSLKVNEMLNERKINVNKLYVAGEKNGRNIVKMEE